jgi:hypothetical protein
MIIFHFSCILKSSICKVPFALLVELLFFFTIPIKKEKLANHASPPPLYFHMPLLKIVVSAYSHQNYAVQIRNYFSC